MNINPPDIDTLKTLLFENIENTIIENLLKNSSGFLKTFSPNYRVLDRDSPYNYLIILTNGEAVSEISSYSGKTVKVEYLKAPEIIAPACLFTEENVPVTITTVTQCNCLYLPKEEIRDWLSHKNSVGEKLSQNMLKIISRKAINLSKRISFLTLNTIEEKFITYLLSLPEILTHTNLPTRKGEKKGNKLTKRVELPISIEELAAYFAVERPSLSRAIGKLEKRGIIKRKIHRSKTKNIFELRL